VGSQKFVTQSGPAACLSFLAEVQKTCMKLGFESSYSNGRDEFIWMVIVQKQRYQNLQHINKVQDKIKSWNLLYASHINISPV
jgi:hypothetical protein